ncbi:hypothetical protein OH687_05570 [Burkholderia anthina]|nr:hypothetical protein OH687_05570 [Burkholderia anthina]
MLSAAGSMSRRRTCLTRHVAAVQVTHGTTRGRGRAAVQAAGPR